MSSSENASVTDKPAPKEQPAAHDKQAEVQSPTAAARESSRNLSQDTFKPGDQKAATAGRSKDGNDAATTLLGKVELNQEKSDKPSLKPEAIKAAATKLHDETFSRALYGWGWSNADPEKIRNVLEPMNKADRKALEQEYEKQYGHKLRDDLKEKLGANSDSYVKIESILNRNDGKSDESGQVRTALNKIENANRSLDSRTGFLNTALDVINPGKAVGDLYLDSQDKTAKRNAEADVRKSIGALTSEQIKEFKDQYRSNYGVDIEQKLTTDPSLSQETRDALKVLFKGVDKRNGSDPESVKNTQELAQIGLKSQNVDIFKDAMQTASYESRVQFYNNNGVAQIDKAFSGDDRDMARSYMERSSGSIANLIEGNSHWYHTNKDEINRIVTSQATDLDRQQFTRGKQLADFAEANKGKQINFTPEDKRDMAFYQRVHDGLKSASSSTRELAQWENKLMKSEKVVSDILDSHTDSNWIGWGAKTDRDKLMSSVENLSKEDWQRLHSNKDAELAKVKEALGTFADEKTSELVIQRLKEKAEAPTYEKSQEVGRRSIEETFADNKSNPGNRLDRILTMNATEREAYKKNPGDVDKLIESSTPAGSVERFAAQRLLQEIKDGKKPDHADQAMLSALKGDSPSKAIKEMEAALKENQGLLGKPPSDPELQKNLRQALDTVVEKAGFGEQYVSSGEGPGVVIPGRQDEFADQIFKNGHMPIELKVQLDGQDKLARYNDIINSTPQEKQRLLANPAPDAASKQFQDRVMGSEDDKQILRYAIQQGKLTEADTFRAFVKGSQTQPEELKDTLSKMTPEQRQNLANEYFTKYGTLITSDVIDKVPDNERFRFREMLSPTDTHVRQIAMDAREEGDRHTSVFDPVLNKLWDKSQLGAVEAQANMDQFVKDHAAEIDRLSPEQKKQFTDAVANYQTAVKNYVESKGAFAEAVVDSAITVAAVGGAFFTGGTSLALLATVGAGGAAFRVAAMKAIQGTDFKDDPENVARQAFKGLVAADLGFIGPEVLGLNGLVKVGEGAAIRTAEGLLPRLTRSGLSETAFKETPAAAQAIIAKELAQVSRQGAIVASKETEAIVQRISEKVLNDGATQAEKDLFQQTLRNELKDQVVSGLRNKVINEAEAYLSNVGTASIANAGSEFLATTVGLEDYKTLFDRMASSAVSGAVGATVFHVGFKGIAAGYHGAKAIIGRDSNGYFAGEGTIVRHEDGKTTVVKEGEQYRFKPGDKVVENLEAQGPPARETSKEGPDGRPLGNDRTKLIQEKFPEIDERSRAEAREAVTKDLKEVKASATEKGPDGKPVSVYDRLMSDPSMSDAQKDRVIDLLANVREHYSKYRLPDGKMLGDQEVNWIHTQGELAKVLESARANKLNGAETENALIASMFSDSAKFTDSALTKGNFTTHHLDGALAAAEVLERRGFPPERIQAITQAIREHQIAPPEFMGFIYQTTIARTLKGQLDSGAITQAKYDQMKKVLDDMTVIGKDGMPRIKQIADVNNAPLVKNGNGEWEVAFTPEQRELMKLSGTDHWYVPHDPKFMADGKTIDPDFAQLPEAEQARRISAYKSSRALIDGDGIDNYATVGGASKIVKIRGPETFFSDKTVWDSVASVDKSFDDASKVLTPEGKRLAQESLKQRNEILNDDKTGIRAQMDNWLRSTGRDPSSSEIPYYNRELKYPEPLNAAEQARMKELQGQKPGTAAEKAQVDAELKSLKYKGLSEQQISDFEFAKQIRDKMTDFMRMAHRTDGTLPGDFLPAGSVKVNDSVKAVFTPGSKPVELPQPAGPVIEGPGGSKTYEFKTADGRTGTVYLRKDGSSIVADLKDPALAKHYDANGRLTKSNGYEFGYDSNGKLNRILEPNGVEHTSDGQRWTYTSKQPDGQIIRGEDLSKQAIGVDPDGTIRYKSYRDEVTAENVDGSIITYRADGRVDYRRAYEFREAAKTRDLIEQRFPDAKRQERVQNLLKEFEERAKRDNIPVNEKALFYQQVNRLLSDSPGAALGLAERVNLAEQVINHAAKPSSVDQGMNNTCNVTTLEHRLYAKDPSKVAQIVADAALTGKYTFDNGQTVDMRSLAGGLKPDFEARSSLKIQEKGKADVKSDGGRDWSSQLAERALVNGKWSKASVLIADGKIQFESALVYDSHGMLRGRVADPRNDVSRVFDKDGAPLWDYKPGQDVYTQDKKLIKNFKPENLVYDSYGGIAGVVDNSKKITQLFDADGKPLTRFGRQDQRAFDKDGKVSIERATPQYDKVGGNGLTMGSERVYYDQMGKEVRLRDEWDRKMDAPGIPTSELHDIYSQVTGRRDDAFVFVRAKETRVYSNELDVATVEDFGKALEKAQRDGNLPGVLLVHTSYPPFSTGLDAATGFMGGWHVVNVQSYDPVTRTLKFTNQWGSGKDYEVKGISIDTMFRSMQDPMLQRAYRKWKYGS